jgi:hypothetical protein
MSSITNSTITTMDTPATDIDKPTKVCTWENSSNILPEAIQAYLILDNNEIFYSPARPLLLEESGSRHVICFYSYLDSFTRFAIFPCEFLSNLRMLLAYIPW